MMLAITPVLAFMGFLIAIWMTKATALINRAYGDANSIAQQALGSVRTVYAFNAEGRTVEAYNEAMKGEIAVTRRPGGNAREARAIGSGSIDGLSALGR